jgi:endonuclease/exonuclease/phosphatase family metal-dependent hydrolase
VNVHLRPAIQDGSWIKGFLSTPPIRRAEIEAHWKTVDTSLPTVVAGDFNEDGTGQAVDFLAGQGLTLVPTKGPTSWHYQDLLSLTIDHVMVGAGLTGSSGEVIDVGASDHRPVVVTLTNAVR